MDECAHGVDGRSNCDECNVYADIVRRLEIAKRKLLRLNEDAAEALLHGDRNAPLIAQLLLETREDVRALEKQEQEERRKATPLLFRRD